MRGILTTAAVLLVVGGVGDVMRVRAADAPLEFTVSEAATPGTVIGRVAEAAAPKSPPPKTTYGLAPQSGLPFQIEPRTGELTLGDQPIDFEQRSRYEFAIKVRTPKPIDAARRAFIADLLDSGAEPGSLDELLYDDAERSVRVDVADVPEAPALASDPVTLVVQDETDGAQTLLTVRDPDIGDTHTFELIAGDLEQFQIDAETGRLSWEAAPDSTDDTFALTVRVTDQSGLSDAATINVQIIRPRPAVAAATPAPEAPERPQEPDVVPAPAPVPAPASIPLPPMTVAEQPADPAPEAATPSEPVLAAPTIVAPEVPVLPEVAVQESPEPTSPDDADVQAALPLTVEPAPPVETQPSLPESVPTVPDEVAAVEPVPASPSAESSRTPPDDSATASTPAPTAVVEHTPAPSAEANASGTLGTLTLFVLAIPAIAGAAVGIAFLWMRRRRTLEQHSEEPSEFRVVREARMLTAATASGPLGPKLPGASPAAATGAEVDGADADQAAVHQLIASAFLQTAGEPTPPSTTAPTPQETAEQAKTPAVVEAGPEPTAINFPRATPTTESEPDVAADAVEEPAFADDIAQLGQNAIAQAEAPVEDMLSADEILEEALETDGSWHMDHRQAGGQIELTDESALQEGVSPTGDVAEFGDAAAAPEWPPNEGAVTAPEPAPAEDARLAEHAPEAELAAMHDQQLDHAAAMLSEPPTSESVLPAAGVSEADGVAFKDNVRAADQGVPAEAAELVGEFFPTDEGVDTDLEGSANEVPPADEAAELSAPPPSECVSSVDDVLETGDAALTGDLPPVDENVSAEAAELVGEFFPTDEDVDTDLEGSANEVPPADEAAELSAPPPSECVSSVDDVLETGDAALTGDLPPVDENVSADADASVGEFFPADEGADTDLAASVSEDQPADEAAVLDEPTPSESVLSTDDVLETGDMALTGDLPPVDEHVSADAAELVGEFFPIDEGAHADLAASNHDPQPSDGSAIVDEAPAHDGVLATDDVRETADAAFADDVHPTDDVVPTDAVAQTDESAAEAPPPTGHGDETHDRLAEVNAAAEMNRDDDLPLATQTIDFGAVAAAVAELRQDAGASISTPWNAEQDADESDPPQVGDTQQFSVPESEPVEVSEQLREPSTQDWTPEPGAPAAPADDEQGYYDSPDDEMGYGVRLSRSCEPADAVDAPVSETGDYSPGIDAYDDAEHEFTGSQPENQDDENVLALRRELSDLFGVPADKAAPPSDEPEELMSQTCDFGEVPSPTANEPLNSPEAPPTESLSQTSDFAEIAASITEAPLVAPKAPSAEPLGRTCDYEEIAPTLAEAPFGAAEAEVSNVNTDPPATPAEDVDPVRSWQEYLKQRALEGADHAAAAPPPVLPAVTSSTPVPPPDAPATSSAPATPANPAGPAKVSVAARTAPAAIAQVDKSAVREEISRLRSLANQHSRNVLAERALHQRARFAWVAWGTTLVVLCLVGLFAIQHDAASVRSMGWLLFSGAGVALIGCVYGFRGLPDSGAPRSGRCCDGRRCTGRHRPERRARIDDSRDGSPVAGSHGRGRAGAGRGRRPGILTCPLILRQAATEIATNRARSTPRRKPTASHNTARLAQEPDEPC